MTVPSNPFDKGMAPPHRYVPDPLDDVRAMSKDDVQSVIDQHGMEAGCALIADRARAQLQSVKLIVKCRRTGVRAGNAHHNRDDDDDDEHPRTHRRVSRTHAESTQQSMAARVTHPVIGRNKYGDPLIVPRDKLALNADAL